MAHDVFISHAQADKPVAELVCATLEQRGIRCWIAPRDIRPGTDWGSAIVAAIRQSRAMVLVFSDAANASRHIPRELERAIDLEIPIVPFRIQNIEPRGSLEYNLALVHWLDAVTPPLDTHAHRLADVVESMLGSPDTAKVEPPKRRGTDKPDVAPAEPPKRHAAEVAPSDLETRPYPLPSRSTSSNRTLWVIGAAVGTAALLFAVNTARRHTPPAGEAATPAIALGVTENNPSGAPGPTTTSTLAPQPPDSAATTAPDATSGSWTDCTGSDANAAVAGCTAIIDAKPDDASRMGRAFFNRGMANYALTNHDRAIDDYTHALALSYNPAYSYNNRGLAYLVKKDFGRASADFDQAIQMNPSFADAYANRADLTLQINKDDSEKAIADYTRAIAIDPKLTRALRNRGDAYYRKADYDNALADYTSALALKPDDADTLQARGLAYARKLDLPNAIADFGKVIDRDPERTDARFSRAVVFLWQRDSERALVDITVYITAKPAEAAGYRVRGIAYFQRSLYVLAKEDLERCLKSTPADAQALYALGTAKQLSGDGSGKHDVDAAVKIDPAIGDLMKLFGVVKK